MGKWTDKLYITHSEWAMSHGPKASSSESSSLPYNYCAISLSPITNNHPYYDLLSDSLYDSCVLAAYIHNQTTFLDSNKDMTFIPHPLLSDTFLDVASLVRLNFYSSNGEFICPITKHSFTNFSPIVALKCTGNVYHLEALETLAFQPRNYVDLLDDSKPFIKKSVHMGGDLIILQDLQKKWLTKRDETLKKRYQLHTPASISAPMVKKILYDLDAKKEAIAESTHLLSRRKATFLSELETTILSTMSSCLGYISLEFKGGRSLQFQLIPDEKNIPILYRFMHLLPQLLPVDFQTIFGVLGFKLPFEGLKLPYIQPSTQKQPLVPGGFYWKQSTQQFLISSVAPVDSYLTFIYLGQVYQLDSFLEFFGFRIPKESVDLEDAFKSFSSVLKLITASEWTILDSPFQSKELPSTHSKAIAKNGKT